TLLRLQLMRWPGTDESLLPLIAMAAASATAIIFQRARASTAAGELGDDVGTRAVDKNVLLHRGVLGKQGAYISHVSKDELPLQQGLDNKVVRVGAYIGHKDSAACGGLGQAGLDNPLAESVRQVVKHPCAHHRVVSRHLGGRAALGQVEDGFVDCSYGGA